MSVVVIGVACEDATSFRALSKLIDDTTVAAHEWLEGVLDAMRQWRGLDEQSSWYKYKREDVEDLRPRSVGGATFKRHGHIRGQPRKESAQMWIDVLAMFHRVEPRPTAVVLAMDADGRPQRLAGMKQAIEAMPWELAIVCALPEPEIEAWHVAGFEPDAETEKTAFAEVRDALSFDPRLESHRLTSHPNDAHTDAKRVLARLCGSDSERVLACLNDRQRLRERGQDNGLVGFLDEVEQRIVPLFGGKGP